MVGSSWSRASVQRREFSDRNEEERNGRWDEAVGRMNYVKLPRDDGGNFNTSPPIHVQEEEALGKVLIIVSAVLLTAITGRLGMAPLFGY